MEPKRVVVDSMRWARLVECAPIAMQQYLDEVVAGTTDAYVHDYSLPLHCPEVMDQLSIPKYFSGAWLIATRSSVNERSTLVQCLSVFMLLMYRR